MWWFTLEGCKQPWQKSSQTWWDWTWDCRWKWNIYCHKCIRSENLQLYMEEMHLCTYWKCYLYNHVGCRHSLAQWAVNMFQGELYGYANFIHQKKMIPASVNYFWEDNYSLQILELGWKSWVIRKLRYETSLVSNACKSSQLDMLGINYNGYTCVVS